MRKSLLFFALFCLSLGVSAQQAVKITFEDAEIGSTGGATAMWDGGSVDVQANTYLTGNPSAKVLHVNNTGYLPVFFSNIAVPAGAETLYSKIRVKYLIIGGTDTNYPSLEIFSSPNSSTAGDTEKIGTLGWAGLWGAAEIGVWKTIEFPFSSSVLTPVPAGNLILKLTKSNTEYLIDDVELVLAPTASSVLVVNDFESNAIDEVLAMKRWGATDATATVKASPTDANNKVVQIVASNWNSCLKQTVVLPAGKVLANYESLSFDIYLNDIAETDNLWKNMEIYVDETKVIDVQSQGVTNAWETRSYKLEALAGGNSFVLDLGVNTNKGNYFIDNIKLHAITSGVDNQDINQLSVYSGTNAFILSQEVDSYELYNIQGVKVSEGMKVSTINTSDLGNGIYILKARINNELFKTKLLK
ncbi:MAG: T9SS type A sorting domain-containing protein [Paludibacter sp.]|nr:T9SS type A sorting domain-containing protein [Paludibacter sp.]